MKIFAIGMNYTEHNKSLHGTLSKPERPVIFTKADSALLNNGKPFFIPDHLGRIEYETEVVVRISKLGKTIPQRFAHRYYDAVTVGIDIQKFRDIQALHFRLDLNDKTVQEGCTSDMLYKVDEIISYISQYFTLKTGDLLYTGCPTGCGPVNIDDHLVGYLEDRKVLDFHCK